MSKAHLPPVPPANRGPAGSATPGEALPPGPAAANKDSKDRNLAIQGRQGNIKTNTTHQGYQQDR
ncbi:hypothetical protein [Pseudoroseomonas cervicalis]|uniref:hypothetical protein n=1 Tax=Teichococcus cervicalis TaxID=204525 RepID=UPI00278AD4BB|nr:hypothetical protein [Pseudoroseomonas cervicalis]MDQ1078452.1 hypothetical protein [Pseudoroseomonas cervicalis]